MKRISILMSFGLMMVLLNGYRPLPFSSPIQAAYAGDDSSLADPFGYVYDDQQPYNWIDASTGIEITPSSPDDGYAEVSLPFPFPYYENVYSTLYVSTNGLISFDNGWTEFYNQPIPRLHTPNNFIAPFWDDLAVGNVYNSGKVYTLYDSKNQAYIVEWKDISRAGDSINLLTFETLLYANGDICFQYEEMNGIVNQATVGIEDADGVNGLQYLYNADGVASLVGTNALCFFAPASAEGKVKLLPPYQSKAAINGKAEFQIQVVNIGSLGEDTFNFQANQSVGSWEIELFQEDGVTPLTDSDLDGRADVRLSEGASITVTVKMATPDLQAGNTSLLNLVAESANTPGSTTTAQIQSAVPAPFVLLFSDGEDGLQFNAVTERTNLRSTVVDNFTGSRMALGEGNDSRYPLVWELNTTTYANLEYQFRNSLGLPLQPRTTLNDNQGGEYNTYDREPNISRMDQNQTAIVWVRNIYDLSSNGQKSNIYLGILHSDGTVDEINVTQNSEFRDASHPAVPTFKSPRVAVADDGNLAVAWEKNTAGVKDIELAIYNATGQPVSKQTITSGSTEIQYIKPSLIRLSNQRFLLFYTQYSSVGESYQLYRAVFSSTGEVLSAPQPLNELSGSGVDCVSFPSETVLIAWTNHSSGRINAVGLDSADFQPVGNAVELTVPYDLRSDSVSVAQTSENQAALVWLDEEWNEHIYYSLIQVDTPAAGSLQILTQPMILLSGQGRVPQVNLSENGQSLSPYYPAYGLYLPLIRKP